MKTSNPLAGAQMVLRNGDPLENLRLGKSNQLALSASTGEFNANDKRELLRAISGLMSSVSAGDVTSVQNSAYASSQEYANAQRERREVLAAAYHDPAKWAALGANLGTRIEEARNRMGFVRNLAMGSSLRQGEYPRVPMPSYDAYAIVATSASDVGYQVIRNKNFMAQEVEIVASVRCEALDIEQISGDILDDAYDQGLDSLMVQEDKLWKRASDLSVGLVNPLEYISGQLSPQNLGNLRAAVTDWNLSAEKAVISNDYWSDITGNTEFHDFLDPVNKYNLVMNGQLGTLVGLELITDAFRVPSQKVLNRGEIYIVSASNTHAAYTDRGGVRSKPTSGADQGNTTQGWLLSSFFSFVLANPRSVAKGQRV